MDKLTIVADNRVEYGTIICSYQTMIDLKKLFKEEKEPTT